MRYWLATLLTLLFLSFGLLPSHALIPLDGPGITQALRHGMQHGRYGLADTLGPNWLEKADGTLLNVYTPFMMLATKVAKGRYPTNPTRADVEAMRKRYAGDINRLTSPYYPVEVKFTLSAFGTDPQFAQRLNAHIEGVGRGKQFRVFPVRTLAPTRADALNATEYDAIIAYYFKMEPITNMDSFDLIIEEAPIKPAKGKKSKSTAPTTDSASVEPIREPIVFHLQRDTLF